MRIFFLLVGLSFMTTAMVGCQNEADAPSTNRTSADTDPVGAEYDPDVEARPDTTPGIEGEMSPPATPPETDPETPPGTTIDSINPPATGQDPAQGNP